MSSLPARIHRSRTLSCGAVVAGLAAATLTAAAPPAAASTPSYHEAAAYTVGGGPRGVVAVGGSLYVANFYDDTVSVATEATGQVTNTITVGTNPDAITADNGSVYVTNRGGGSVSVISEASSTVIQTITVGTNPDAIVADGGNLWVANEGTSTAGTASVSMVNESTDKVTNTFTDTAHFLGLEGIAAVNGTVYVSSEAGKYITTIDEATQGISGHFTVCNGPDGLVAAGGDLYYACYLTDQVGVIDLATSTVSNINLSAGAGPTAVAAHGDEVFAVESGLASLAVIDESTSTVSTSLALGGAPTDVVADGTNLYVSDFAGGAVDVVNQAPDAVTDVQVDNTDDDQLTVSWTDPASDNGRPATGYEVFDAPSSGAEDLSGTPACSAASATATSCTVSGLTSGDAYYFQVVATGSLGDSQPTAEIAGVPLDHPGAPAGLTATASNDQVSLTWTAPDITDVTPVASYDVYDATTPGGESSADSPACSSDLGDGQSAPTTSCTVTGLTNGTQYYFVVYAYNIVGLSAASGEVSATPLAPPTLTVSDGHRTVANGATVPLSGTAPTGAAVKLYAGTSPVGSTTAVAGLFKFSRKISASTKFAVVAGGYVSNVVAVKTVGLSIEVGGHQPFKAGVKHKLHGAAPAGFTVTLQRDGKKVATAMVKSHNVYHFTRKLTGTHSYRISCDGVASKSLKIRTQSTKPGH